jgi:hypothetical protein
MPGRIRLLALVVPLALLANTSGCRQDSMEPLPPSKPISAEQLRETDVLPHLEGPVIAGRNCVYCATFQLAWNQSQDKIFGEPIHLSGSPPMAKDLLRGDKLAEDMLPPGSYLIRAGLVKDGVVEKIREEIAKRFPNATLHVPDHLEDQWAIAYAYLQRPLKFREAFDRLKEPLVFRSKDGPVRVACFGVRNLEVNSRRDQALAGQVTVLADAGDDDFVLRLNTVSEDDEMILAKVKPKQTLGATVSAVRERIKRRDGLHEYGPTGLMRAESLVVPIIDLNVQRKYTELEGRFLTNPKWSKIQLAIAEQGIRFRLDENGARLESTAYEGWKSEGRMKPAQYIFDKPFLLYLKRKSSDQPYLAIWIETPVLLKKVGK